MARPWAEVIKDEAYQKYSAEDKAGAREAYYQQVIVPQIKNQDPEEIRRTFYSYADKIEPKPPEKDYSTLEKAVERTNYFKGAGEVLNKIVDAVNPFMSEKEYKNLRSEVERVEKGGGGDIPVESNVLDDPVFMGVMGGAGFGKYAYKAGQRGVQLAKTVAGHAADEALMNAPSIGKMAIKSITPRSQTLDALDAIKKIGEKLPDVAPDTIEKAVKSTWQRKVLGQELEVRDAHNVVEEMTPHKPITMDDQLKMAQEKILNDPVETKKLLSKKEFSSLDQAALGPIAKQEVMNMAKEAVMGSYTPELFRQKQDDVFKTLVIAGSEGGRGLRNNAIENAYRRLGAAWGKLERGLNERELNELKDLYQRGLMENPEMVKRYAERLGDPKFKDYFFEVWYNSILSGVPTHLVNMSSNFLWQAYQVPHRTIAASVDKLMSVFPGWQRKYFFNEILPSWSGVKSGFAKGAKGFGETVKTGKAVEWQSKFDTEMGGAIMGAFDRSPKEWVRKLAPAVTMPSRLLSGMDIWFKSIGYDTKMLELSKRAGIHPREATKEMMQEAAEYAKYVTFNNDPGKLAKHITAIREDYPFVRMIMPFVSTPGNLLKRGIELTPGLGLMLAKGKSIQEVAAKQIEGAIIGGFLWNKLERGEMTGAAPKNRAEREAFYREGKLPWAIRVGDKWIQYRRIEPFNTAIAAVAMAYDNVKNRKDDEALSTTAWKIADSIRENIIDTSYMQGLQNLFNQYGRVEGAAQRTLASLVPYSSLFRSVNRAVEAGMTGQAKVRDTSTLKGAFSQVIPGGHTLVKPRLDVFGEEQVIEGGPLRQWFPYKWSTEKKTQLGEELSKFKITPGRPGQRMTISGVNTEIPDELYREYEQAVGRRMKDYAERVVSSENYKKLNDERKEKRLKSALQKARTVEMDKLKREFRFKKSMLELQ